MVHETTTESNRRQRRRAERTEDWVRIAMEIVVAEGIDALTVGRLAAAADSAIGAVYRYFPSKDALLTALQVRAVESFALYMEAAVAEARGNALSKVWAAFAAWPAFAEAEPEHFALADASLSDPRPVLGDEAALAVDRAIAPVLSRCAALLEQAVAEGALAPGDAALRAHVLWAAVHGVAHFRKRDRLGPIVASSAVRDEMIATLLRGWGGDHAAISDCRAARP